MRNILRIASLSAYSSTLVLLLLSFVAPQRTSAQTNGSSASGSYQFSLEDGYTKYLEFDAQKQADGHATGQMTFSDEAAVSIPDPEGTGDPNERDSSASGVYIKADFDDLAVDRNRAVMSGTIVESSVRSYIGQRVLLVVEDNGDDITTPDKLTWGVYNPVVRGWTPADAEWRDDTGASLTWMATDAEFRDDVGVPYPKRDEATNCQSFPLSSYSFVDAQRGAGNIRVQ